MNGVALVLILLAAPAAAQDIVRVSSARASGEMKVTGRVLDYTGNGLRLQLTGGRERTFPVDQVLEIETARTRNHDLADMAFALSRFEQALTLYRQALQDETRHWVRRQIIARMVYCYRSLDQPGPAGETFLLLIRSDPSTPYFDCIPLAWISRQPSPALAQSARQWLSRTEPAAVLLGASHLLGGPSHRAALAKLNGLVIDGEGRVSQLALAQTWRAALATADESQLVSWQRTIEKIPEPLAAGPNFVVGLALAQRQQWEQSALAMMRVAILYRGQRALAARSLLEAGRALERLERTKQAVHLYRELIREYPNTRPVAEARSRIEAVSDKL
ncbi:MAG: tetratricopeptide repeat protein [Thermoguttaceae bacterium]